ncbi:Putative uncharacterized protein [Moritella viscosa]|uniref:Uncharacterized protein n=1 Tax=Moritella viscosa TaxID=80854 RepID=A0ABY1H903_9GAMM|nr:Putative uncharacterized protein [Moritella viscosa]SGY87002.1 Putative uncharacterized protein [Moritella viscosa]SHO24663.1 Putative uncharacterized protein [Moritella viscosa]
MINNENATKSNADDINPLVKTDNSMDKHTSSIMSLLISILAP